MVSSQQRGLPSASSDQGKLSPPPAASRQAPPAASGLLAVDQQLGKGAAFWVAPELSDPVGSLEVREHREHQDVEQLGAGIGWLTDWYRSGVPAERPTLCTPARRRERLLAAF